MRRSAKSANTLRKLWNDIINILDEMDDSVSDKRHDILGLQDQRTPESRVFISSLRNTLAEPAAINILALGNIY